MQDSFNIIHGDCLEIMLEMTGHIADAVVTDPPYELGFMGKEWDKTGIANNVKMWAEVLRILKPGGHLLSFGGTRTYHRMACAIEDAGFEIRDQIQWIYGSGFPKSLDISKAIDKAAGVKREVVGKRTMIQGGGNALKLRVGPRKEVSADVTLPATPAAKQWDGWGTGLKPANEPICLARSPLWNKNIATNVLRWGTGAINIDGCRVGSDEITVHLRNGPFAECRENWKDSGKTKTRRGRQPANVILDEEAGRMLDKQSGYQKTGKPTKRDKRDKQRSSMGVIPWVPGRNTNYFNLDLGGGGASRFFYCAKASRKEREAGLGSIDKRLYGMSGGAQGAIKRGDDKYDKGGINRVVRVRNNHPTVKPLSLMRYLVRLITPPGGTVLDPFMGSGTTGMACIEEGFNFIGIELNKEYCEIARKRIEYARRQFAGTGRRRVKRVGRRVRRI